MKNFKEIAEKCLAGELSGRFKNRKGESIPSRGLFRTSSKKYPYTFYYSRHFTIHGKYFNSHELSEYDIIDFIPDNMQEQIKIDIPEGKVPVMEQTEKGVVITWKEKELTYDDIFEKLSKDKKYIGNFGYNTCAPNLDTPAFYQKMGILHKLVNIRNYFGKSKCGIGYIITRSGIAQISINYTNLPVFAKKEHAEQAAKMLGNELTYLFEPW